MAEIIYVFDGYCGWCWGMDAVVTRLATEFKDRFAFSARCGGLMVGDRIGPLGNFADYIERAIPRVEEMTGAVFAPAHRALLRQRDTMQDSRVPAAAFIAVQKQNPGVDTITLAHEILQLNFSAGYDLSRPQNYADLFRKYKVDLPQFTENISAGSLYSTVEEHFAAAHDMGAEAFPTIVYGREGEYFPLCQGYQSFENLAHALDTLHREPPPL